jgi:Ca-activated chloride channel family protein
VVGRILRVPDVGGAARADEPDMTTRARAWRVLFAAAGIGLAGPGTAAQQAVFRATTNVVPVYATVTGPDGQFVDDLSREDFTVLDNGAPQEITTFADEAQAISASVILDTSSRMAGAEPRLFAAASAFLDELLPGDRATIGSLLYLGPPLTSDRDRLRSSLDLLPRDEGSPLWMALDRAVTVLQPESNRRVIVVYTDGRNEQPRYLRRVNVSEASVRARVEAAGVMVYAIGIEGTKLTGAVKTLARRSGGRATELAPGADLAAALAAVAGELHQQYLLGFTPAAFDGRTHRLEVRVRRPGVTVRAREVYVAVN